jgi:hypothetical protein
MLLEPRILDLLFHSGYTLSIAVVKATVYITGMNILLNLDNNNGEITTQ